MQDIRLKLLRLEGKNFYLRVLTRKDINKKYLSWLNDKEVTQYLETAKKSIQEKI